MSATITGPVYGLKVPAGDEIIPATAFPASFRITMAAIDPTALPKADAGAEEVVQRATLKLIRERIDPDEDDDYDDDEDDIDDIEAIKARLGEALSEEEDEESSDDDEEKNGGPSDPSRTKKARKEALLKALANADEDMDLDTLPNGVNGISSKGKGKAVDIEDDSEEEEDDEIEEFVLCTLDPNKNFQQTLDITVDEDEEVYFKVSGTHNIYITGNYVFPAPRQDVDDDDSSDGDYDMDYDLSPDEDELDIDSDEESDELDALEDPRITEVDSEDEVPKLVSGKKGKNKRSADESDEESATLDALIDKSLKPADATTNGEKLSKKQLKKLKKNDGQSLTTSEEQSAPKKDAKSAGAPAKSDKKVQFAKNLEQGPTGSPKVDGKSEPKKDGKSKEEAKPATGMKVVNGVKIDDKKVGKGRAAKAGDKLGMRYIGKLESGKVFDANKKGAPFKFTLGKGEVIKGWDVGVAGMTVGGERRITVPANMGYGSKKLPDIPANSTLVFDIKLLSIN